ncbi:MAG: hypothetical protein MUF48_08725 [Pirellulaceae bacterium]|nr:hypothetical protein [Pirellulaceae bacterium]
MSRGFRPHLPHSTPERRLQQIRSTRSRRSFAHGKRARGWERLHCPYLPPEDWYEPSVEAPRDYRVVVQEPGDGYRHVVTPETIRERLAALPPHMLERLRVIQLSRMTRKKRTLPCYGMQWGSALYLYPVEDTLIEYFSRPPLAAERREAEMYGGRWEEAEAGEWRLVWTPATIRDFYLNNILMHELGHLLDDRNRSYTDRERFADWFAIQYGYKSAYRRALGSSAPRETARRRAAVG